MNYQRLPIFLLAFAVSILCVAHFFMLPRLACMNSSEALVSKRFDYAQILNEALADLHQFLLIDDAENRKQRLEDIKLIHCRFADTISTFAENPNPNLICQKEDHRSTENLSISERNAGLRKVLLADDADKVEADSSKSAPDTLAAALEWTRRREQGLLDQVKKLTLENVRIKSVVNEKKSMEIGASESVILKRSFAADTWPEDSRSCSGDTTFRTLISADGSFEGGMQDGPRIDGIIQREHIYFKYHISTCTDSGRLSGVFRVHKLLDCDETVHVSDDAELSRIAKEQYGPDEFTLNLIGPEMHSLNPQMTYRGSCR